MCWITFINLYITVLLGTGNFAMWDQRTALLWVKENIAQFGGDPDLVTIFGESAGAGSVSAQAMGQHNDGLFKRAIQQVFGSLCQLSNKYFIYNQVGQPKAFQLNLKLERFKVS